MYTHNVYTYSGMHPNKQYYLLTGGRWHRAEPIRRQFQEFLCGVETYRRCVEGMAEGEGSHILTHSRELSSERNHRQNWTG